MVINRYKILAIYGKGDRSIRRVDEKCCEKLFFVTHFSEREAEEIVLDHVSFSGLPIKTDVIEEVEPTNQQAFLFLKRQLKKESK